MKCTCWSGYDNGMLDLADVSIEAGFDAETDLQLLTKYLDRTPGAEEQKHFLANKIYVDYLWTLWAKARVPYDGQPMEDWAAERYARMVSNIQKFRELQNAQ